MKKRLLRILLAMRAILITSLLALRLGPAIGITAGQQPAPSASPNACPTPGAAQVADAVARKFDRHQFVLIHGTHGTAKIDEFLICLVSRPAFTRRATDIVAEWASYAQQPLLDQYLLTLDAVAAADLIPIPLTAEQQRELARRNSIKFGNDPQSNTRKRYEGRAVVSRPPARPSPKVLTVA